MIDAYNASDESFKEGHVVGARNDSGLPDYLFKSPKRKSRAVARKLVYPPFGVPLSDEDFTIFIEHFNDGEVDAGYVNDYQPEYLGRNESGRSVWG